jgi:HEPN domain-containing protein
MPPELREVQAWVEKADRDRRTAEAALRQNPPITDTAAFHAQQVIEKLLKAYLVWRCVEFERIHDLEALLDACAASDPEFATLKPAVAPLTAYAVRFRYPGPAEPSVEQVRAALAVVNRVWEFVLSRLPADIGQPR